MKRRDVLAAGIGFGALALCRPGWARGAATAEDGDLSAILKPGARLETLYEGGRWCEGPCWLPERGGLVFSDVRANRMMLLTEGGEAQPYRDPSDNANGSVLDAQGRLVTCQHRTRSIVREEADGTLTTLADRFDGKRLNSPNDAVLASDGAIWFTDPVYGIRQPDEGLMAEPEQAARRVYRIAPDGRLEARIARLDQPNGLAFSPDGATLYVSESGAALNPEGPSGIWAFGIGRDGSADEGRLFAAISPGVSDGLAVSEAGLLFAACQDGVRIFGADGTQLGRIPTATASSNVAFGGPDGRRLFITAGEKVHAIDLQVAGLTHARP